MHLEFFIVLAAVIGSTIGFFAACLISAHKRRGLYNRGWNAGREFAIRQLHDTISH